VVLAESAPRQEDAAISPQIDPVMAAIRFADDLPAQD
jgi:hypothetical protein